jgi:tetratricopeptide (TPR) repeat protein
VKNYVLQARFFVHDGEMRSTMVVSVPTFYQRFFWFAVALCLMSSGLLSQAQRTNPAAYYQQCLKFEAGNDLTTAAQNCRNALELDPNYTDAKIALSRILVAQGNLGEARSQLSGLGNNPEVSLLLADIALQNNQLDEAAGHIRTAQGLLAETPNAPAEAKAYFLQGRLAAILEVPSRAIATLLLCKLLTLTITQPAPTYCFT